ncbi:hypothetical protein CEN44_07670 [Fischerella muscicola CCMEE 5323]|uniref:Uncharacterized protein n=1 Tax=Fischerella muscicola CCMEE 5323 TaxID=2019572 RepID=A0A2N6K5J6_FISMU|nr:hypothetical protein CEN44_07670 [Fischerella muscicola CCMEE 5323]
MLVVGGCLLFGCWLLVGLLLDSSHSPPPHLPTSPPPYHPITPSPHLPCPTPYTPQLPGLL